VGGAEKDRLKKKKEILLSFHKKLALTLAPFYKGERQGEGLALSIIRSNEQRGNCWHDPASARGKKKRSRIESCVPLIPRAFGGDAEKRKKKIVVVAPADAKEPIILPRRMKRGREALRRRQNQGTGTARVIEKKKKGEKRDR